MSTTQEADVAIKNYENARLSYGILTTIFTYEKFEVETIAKNEVNEYQVSREIDTLIRRFRIKNILYKLRDRGF